MLSPTNIYEYEFIGSNIIFKTTLSNFQLPDLPLHCRYIPIGVLYDLLCADPERPWNLTVSLELFKFSHLFICLFPCLTCMMLFYHKIAGSF